MIDFLNHAHHLPGDELVPLVVACEIELRERLSFLALMAELTANAESAGEVAHGSDNFHYGRRVRNDLRVDQRVRRKFPRRLRRCD